MASIEIFLLRWSSSNLIRPHRFTIEPKRGDSHLLLIVTRAICCATSSLPSVHSLQLNQRILDTHTHCFFYEGGGHVFPRGLIKLRLIWDPWFGIREWMNCGQKIEQQKDSRGREIKGFGRRGFYYVWKNCEILYRKIVALIKGRKFSILLFYFRAVNLDIRARKEIGFY